MFTAILAIYESIAAFKMCMENSCMLDNVQIKEIQKF